MPSNITVVVPYHNEEKVLARTLDRIARQTFKPKKVLLVDSSSTDGGKALVDRWIKTRIRGRRYDFILPGKIQR